MTCLPFDLYRRVAIGPLQSADSAFAPVPNKVYNIACGKNDSLPDAYFQRTLPVGFDKDPAFSRHAQQYSALFLFPGRKHHFGYVPAVRSSAAGPVSS